MELTEQASRALDVVRRDGRDVRFTVDEVCHSGRHRLSVRYRSPAGDAVRLGLAYSEDRAALEALREALEGHGAAGCSPAAGERGAGPSSTST